MTLPRSKPILGASAGGADTLDGFNSTDFAMVSSNGSDFLNAATFRTNLGLLAKEGSNTGRIQFKIFDKAYQDNSGFFPNVPGTTIAAVTKFYTVPAGHIAHITMGHCNPTVSPVTSSVYAMADSVTTPTANDRAWIISSSANNTSTAAGELVLDEGGSLWAWAVTNAAVHLTPYILLIPKPMQGGTWTPRWDKMLTANADNMIHSIAAGSNWAQGCSTGLLSNTTASPVNITTKLYRAATNDTITIHFQNALNNATSTWMGGQDQGLAVLMPGDIIYVNPNGAGISLSSLWCDRPIAGVP